jgi:hypothetical protein
MTDMVPVYNRWGVTVFEGDNLAVLRGMPDCSVDSIVTDPPAGVRFMNRAWDSDMGGRHQWVAWLAERMAEAFRVLKPGGHALVWALPRTSHWTAWALEDAGFEVRDAVQHLNGAGYPKSLDVSKAIDKAAGAEREVIGATTAGESSLQRVSRIEHGYRTALTACTPEAIPITAPTTDAARQWSGFGTALKPAAETWWLCRKPFPGTVAANVQTYGTGALNIDGCRIGAPESKRAAGTKAYRPHHLAGDTNGLGLRQDAPHDGKGRWPANVVLSHSAFCGEQQCDESCPVAELDRQGVGTRSEKPGARGKQAPKRGTAAYGDFRGNVETPRYEDAGGTSRFFPVFRWEPKAPTAERPRVNGKAHSTVKSVDLMRWLCRLITPPGGLVLDLFAGTGTTGQAARAEGLRAILIEDDPDSIPLIRARLDAHPKTEATAPDSPDAEPVRDLLDLLDGPEVAS